MSNKLPYDLSEEAISDLEQIFDHTEIEFGVLQAEQYLLDLKACIIQLSFDPKLGRSRPEIRLELRSMPINKHVVFYRIIKKRIRVIRVLHGSQDLYGKFK